ncbi:MAG: hypothetical protein EOO90_09220 [Pedobacter sp.]|nr:MAG: hypothetical protein EOO90_09220 [Pedobacter sp.]
MKKNYILAVITILFFNACTSAPEKKSTLNESGIENLETSPFTDTVKLDTFKVLLQGEKAKESTLVFRIISFEGKEIYQAQISGHELTKENTKLKTETDKMKFLKNEVKYFFEDEHFLWPAVMPNEQPDKNVPDTTFYQELKESQLNGFNYRLGVESKVYIAWSAKDKKVKVYYKI